METIFQNIFSMDYPRVGSLDKSHFGLLCLSIVTFCLSYYLISLEWDLKTSHSDHEHGRTSDTQGKLINIRRNRPSSWLSDLLPFKFWRTLSSSYTQTHECSFHTVTSSDVIVQADAKLEFESLFVNLLRNRPLTLLPSFSSVSPVRRNHLTYQNLLMAGVCRSRSTCDASSGGEMWCLLPKWYILYILMHVSQQPLLPGLLPGRSLPGILSSTSVVPMCNGSEMRDPRTMMLDVIIRPFCHIFLMLFHVARHRHFLD